jgi:hypothetical protein
MASRRNQSPTKGKQPTNTSYEDEEEQDPQYPDLTSQTEHDDEVLALKAQVQALQTAQVQQAIETKSSLSSMEKMMQQLLSRDNDPDRSHSPLVHVPQPQQEPPAALRPTIEQDAPQLYKKKKSTRLDDPLRFSNGIDEISFEAWRAEMRNKLRQNADHYEEEEDRMGYVFGRTKGDAREHLLTRWDEDCIDRFLSADEMFSFLATIYVNPNKERDARYAYNSLRMKSTQTFAEFQTQFLKLAGTGKVPRESLRIDLYDKLTAQMRDSLAVLIDDLDTYEKLAKRCLTLDSEQKRNATRAASAKKYEKLANTTLTYAPVTKKEPASTTTPVPRLSYTPVARQATITPEIKRSTAPSLPTDYTLNPPITCYNCGKPGHVRYECPDKPATSLKDIEEDETEYESGKEYA